MDALLVDWLVCERAVWLVVCWVVSLVDVKAALRGQKMVEQKESLMEKMAAKMAEMALMKVVQMVALMAGK